MDEILSALADPGRRRLVSLLAERPRSVGVLAQLAGARQPQTTKHLQTLVGAGLVTAQRIGTRRIYALRSAPLRALAADLIQLADRVDAVGGAQESFERHRLTVSAERLAADTHGWADGRMFRFRRSMSAAPEILWRHLTEPSLLAQWWAPDDLRISGLAFDARPGGRILLEYRDAEDAAASDTVAGRAEGSVEEARPFERLSYWLSPQRPDGTRAFTAHVQFGLRRTGTGAALDIDYRISDSSVDSADFIAGIELGFGQSLDKLAATVATAGEKNDTDRATERDTTPRSTK